MSNYTATIGLEVHVELATKSKMFCGCLNAPHQSEPNANVCPVCMAHPGTLPVPNEEAIEKVLVFGRAVGATQATYSEFDRKNYFYPDIPKAYQISQYAFPLLEGGVLAGVTLTRVHLEEDTARSQHDKGEGSLVDFNRAGVPLMELVTEPVIHDAATAGQFARELQLLLRTLGISTAQMERGEMRVEANISVSADATRLGTKVEVKNLNSFRSVEGAIAYEIERQVGVLERGECIIQETRGWDEVKLRTFTQRVKETAKDYRYFPDPDIPKLQLSVYAPFSDTRLSEKIPELPEFKRKKYKDIGLAIPSIELLISDQWLDEFFAELYSLVAADDSRQQLLTLGANYLLSDVVALRASGAVLENLVPTQFLVLLRMLQAKEITSRVAKDLLPELVRSGADPRQLATERGLLRASDSASLEPVVAAVIAEHPAVVADFKAGKESLLQFLIGQGMKKTKGSADPTKLAEIFRRSIL